MSEDLGQSKSLKGKLVSERTGTAPPRLPLAVARLETLRASDPDAPAPAEAMTASEMDGSFSFEDLGGLSGEQRWAVFTLSPLYSILAPEGGEVGPGVPTVGDLIAAWPKGIGGDDAEEAQLVARPLCAHEPYTEMVPMSDGTCLATEVFLPEGEGPWPVILTRTPYGRFAFHADAARAMQAGYAFVAQDHRGRFDSEGENLPFIGCGWEQYRDGYDTVEWIASQPWCTGKVATFGGSAMGITQYLMAPTAPPHLVCQVIVVGTPDLFAHADYPGGLLRKEQVVQWTTDCQFDEQALHLFLQHYTRDEWTERFNAAAPEQVVRVQAPALHLGGWYDIFGQGTIDGYWGRQHRGGPGARGTQRLIMGPWTHAAGSRTAGEVEWPENAAMDLWDEALRFLNWWMKGEDDGISSEPPVRYYLMGAPDEEEAPGKKWVFAEDWPPPADETPYYLRAGGKLSPEPATDREGHETFMHDPLSPVPSRGGWNLFVESGPMDQQILEQRRDVLVWTSEPLEAPLAIAGRVRARLWVSSNCLDTDFVVKLCDVHPDGRSMLICYGGLRMRFREGQDHEVLLELDEIYEVEIDLWSTAHVFNTGHRLRVDVQSSDYPHFDVNPGTGERLHEHTGYMQALNRVYMGGDRPSRLVLPRLREV